MVQELLRRHWPPEGQIRLLIAALADPDAARQAWRQWRAENDLAAADHADVRLLAAVAGRIREIEPDLPLDPRLEGMRRYIWAVNQITLAATRPLLATLQAAGIRQMLIKGAARLASDPGVAKERAVRDIDVLVHPDDWERTLEVVYDAGWRRDPKDNDRITRLKSHAVGLTGPNSRAGGEFDLHRFAIRQNQCIGQDLGFWERAQRASFHGIDLLCPSRTDQAIVTLSQAVLFNHLPHPAHWALDMHAFIRAGEIDWDLFLREAGFRRIELFVASPLLLLRERLQCPVPDAVLAELTRPLGRAYEVEFETRATRYNPSSEDAIGAFRVVAAARAMRMARARPVPAGNATAQAPAIVRIPSLGRDAKLQVPVPAERNPFARMRVEISFRAWHAGRHSRLRIMSQDLIVGMVPVAQASRKLGGRIRYTAVLRFPACLMSTRGVDTLLVRTDRKLAIRDLCIRFGPPQHESALARGAWAARSWIAARLPFRRRSAAPASP